MQALNFHGTAFDIIDRSGQPWLRGHQIGVALDYKRTDIIAKLYRANAAEFTASMTAVVKLPTAGGEQDVRIFSLRGAHLLGMFARTARAAEFRRWVLDVLEAQTPQTPDTPIGQKSLGWVHSRPVPRLHFQPPPPVGQNRTGGRTIEAAKATSSALLKTGPRTCPMPTPRTTCSTPPKPCTRCWSRAGRKSTRHWPPST